MADLEIRTLGSYQHNTFPFPKDEIPTSQKTAQWGRKVCEAIYAAYVTDRTGIPYSNIDELHTLRKFAEGSQDVSRYQKILLDESEEGGDLEGFMNINWDPLAVMPKFLHIIQGIMEEQGHSIVASAVDPKSSETREISKLRKWFKGRYKPVLDAVNRLSNYQPEPEWIPETLDELGIYEQAGGFKMVKETEIEEGLDYSFYISDWDEIKRKMIYDFASINCAAVKDYTDQYTRKAKVRYVNPAKLIIQYSRYWDHRNSEYGGEIIQESISNIRKNTNISEDELRQIAQFYNGRYANQTISSWSEEDLKGEGGGWKYDTFMIDVVDACWFSLNHRGRTYRTNSRGDTFSYDEKEGKVYDKPDKKTVITKYKVVYRCKWIIGTNFVYDFGLQYDTTRPGKKEVELPYKFYKLPGRSIVDLARANIDQMELTWFKLQNAIAMATNSGIAVEYTSLMNMTLGGQKMEPLDILTIRRDTGDLIYKATTHLGKPNLPGGMRPIQELTGGIGPQLNEYITLLEMNLEMIRELTGINKIADASTPDPQQSVGGSQMAIAATNNALKPLYSAYIRLYEQVARSLAIRIQILIKHDKEAYEGYIPVVGGSGVKILSVGADVIDADYEIKIQAKPTRERKQVILEAAMKSMQPDRDGYVGIEEGDFIMIERLLENGNEKLAEIMLNYRSRKNKERQQRLQRENMQLDAKREQETTQLKAQLEREGKAFDNDLEIKKETVKADLEDRNNDREHRRKLEQIALEKSYETKTDQLKTKTA